MLATAGWNSALEDSGRDSSTGFAHRPPPEKPPPSPVDVPAQESRRVEIKSDKKSSPWEPLSPDISSPSSTVSIAIPSKKPAASIRHAEREDDPEIMVEERWIFGRTGADIPPVSGDEHKTKGQELLTISQDAGQMTGTPRQANAKSQEDDLPSPNSKDRGLGELEWSESHVKDQGDNADRTSTKSSNDRAWEQIFVTREQLNESELTGLRENQEALKAKHRAEIRAISSKKVVLQRRLKKLSEQKASSGNDSRVQNAAAKHAVNTSWHFPGNYDEIKEKDSSTTTDCQQPGSAKGLQEQNTQLRDLLASMRLRKKDLTEALRHTRRHNNGLNDQIILSQASNRLVANEVQKARRDVELLIQRMNHIEFTLKQEPCKYADLKLEIKKRDEKYDKLAIKAGQKLTLLKRLEIRSEEYQATACAEIAELKIMLGLHRAEMKDLVVAQRAFQRQSEKIRDKLESRILPSDLLDSMNEYFQFTVRDNEVLKKKIQVQMRELSLNKDTIESMSLESQSLKRQKMMDQQTQAELEDRCSVQLHGIEVGRLEIEIECAVKKQTLEIEECNRQIANVRSQKDDRSREIDNLVRTSDESSFQQLVQTQNFKIAGLNATILDLRAERWALQRREHDRIEEVRLQREVAYSAELEFNELKIRLSAADQELAELRREVGEGEIIG
ncbi:hypothetical protein MMC07_008099 [Pseudocyphellaria aurata]|nr:hypothetical protein [Pseudocyphellaria aurata]